MRRLIIAGAIAILGALMGISAVTFADEPAPASKCEYKKCSSPLLSGGGLKNPPAPGEKARGPYSSICQTPINWCVIGPGLVGEACYCNTYTGPVFGVVVE